MSDGNKRDPANETREVDGSVLLEAQAHADKRVGEVSDEELDHILADDVEQVDRTREIDVRAIREQHGGS